MAEIGFNLEFVDYWSGEEPFVDRIHTGQGWVAKDASGNNISATLAHDANGDITDLHGVSTLGTAVELDPPSASTPDEYILTYDGTAKVQISGGKIVSQTAGKVVFDATQGSAVITFSGLNANDPIHDAHVVRADQVGLFNAGEIFNPDFVAKVSQMSMVRFMDWGNTNGFKDVSWATHATVSDTFWSYQASPDGVPIEAMVKLCNEAHVDMYYNIPTKADDTYVTNALTYIRDHLDPNLKVHVEWSNEVWNAGFKQFAYAQQQADALWGNGSAVKYGEPIYYGYRSAQIADIAHKVFTGSHADQVVDVIAGHNNDSFSLNYILQGAARAGVGSTTSLFGEYAMAPYFGGEMGTGVAAADLQTIVGWAKSGAAGMDAAFHELEFGGSLTRDSSLAVIDQIIAKTGQMAAANGLDLITYEGGLSLATSPWNATDTPVVQDFFNRLLADPRMGQLYAKEISALEAAGAKVINFYNDTGKGGDSGSWGALASIYDSNSPRYDAIMGANNKVTALASGGWTLKTALGTDALGTGTVASGGGWDTLPGASSSDATPIASHGHIVGTADADDILASNENDTVDAAGGDDVVTGSSSSADALGHLIEQDVYMGGAGADTITGGDGNDHIYGNELTTVAGSVDGADSLLGGGGNDYLQGNAGNDTIDGGDGNDRIYGGADNDSMTGGAGHDYMQGNKGMDVLSGGDGNDTIHGGADNDMVRGDAGNDDLYGDAGNDSLIGGTGIDTLTGGAGNDSFVFSAHDAAFATTGAAAWKTDEITDFTHALDKIVLDFHATQVLHSSAGSVAAAYTSASAALAAHAGEADVAQVTVGNDTYLFWDAGGQGGAIDSAVKVDHLHDSFTLADFG